MEKQNFQQKIQQSQIKQNRKKMMQILNQRRKQLSQKLQCKIQQKHLKILSQNNIEQKVQLLVSICEQLINGQQNFEYDQYQLLWIINHLTQIEDCKILFSGFDTDFLNKIFEFFFNQILESNKVDSLCTYVLANCIIQDTDSIKIQEYYKQQLNIDKRSLEYLKSNNIKTTTKINLSYLLFYFAGLKNIQFAQEILQVVEQEISKTNSKNYQQNLIILAYMYLYFNEDQDEYLMNISENLMKQCIENLQDLHKNKNYDIIYATIFILNNKFFSLENNQKIQDFIESLPLKQILFLLEIQNEKVQQVSLLFLINILLEQQITNIKSFWFINFSLIFEYLQQLIFSGFLKTKIESARLLFAIAQKTSAQIFDELFSDKIQQIQEIIIKCLKEDYEYDEELVLIGISLIQILSQNSELYREELQQNDYIKTLLQNHYESQNNQIQNLVSQIVEQFYKEQLKFFLQTL